MDSASRNSNAETTGSSTLYGDLARVSGLHPDRIACIGLETIKGTRSTLTYRELKEKVDSFAEGLKSLGVNRGDVVSVQLPNVIEFSVVLYAILKIGAIFNGITSIYREREVEFILKRTESKVYIIPREFRGFDYLSMGESIKSRVPTLCDIVTMDKGESADDSGGIAFASLFRAGSEGDASSADALVQLAFTSGTTGEPKGVMHTHETLRKTVMHYCEHVQPPSRCVNLVVSPVGHQTGFLWGVLLSTYLAGTAVYLDLWSPESAWKAILEEKVTMMFGVSSFLKDLVLAFPDQGSPGNSLDMVSIPGAPIPRWLVNSAASTLDCRVVPAWGMTEYGIAIAVGVSDPEDAYQTDGSVVPGAQARVVGSEGTPAREGEEGDLQIRGDGLFIGYYKRPDLVEENFVDGWFKTGDRAKRTQGGFITLTGRTKDLIVRGGENIPVQDIENVLSEWDWVKDVSIVAMPDDRLGERACVFVVPAPNREPTLEAMRRYLGSKKVTKQFWPERLECVAQLPLTPSGKVQKYLLRENVRKIIASS